jgi:uncharacterized protein YqhQ
VHGPTAWACAIRSPSGELKVAAARKRLRAANVRTPLLRGPARLVEAFGVLPELRRRLPEARLPFERPGVLAATAATSVVVRLLRDSDRLGPAAQELVSGLLALAPATFALRGSDLAAYHGAEHVSIGTYEHGEERPKEHERCGSHLVGPMLITTAAGNIAAAKAPPAVRPLAKAAAAVGAVAASVEVFAWMTRHPSHPVARALAKPGHELQHRVGTREPTAAQLEVAEAALRACLELET